MAVVRSRKTPRGAAAVELAVVLPLLLLLLMGLMEYGWMFLKAQQISNAARQGARTGARADATAVQIDQAGADAMEVAGLGGSGYQLTVTPADPGSLNVGELLTVEVSVPYSNIGFGVPLAPTPASLASMVTMAREGP